MRFIAFGIICAVVGISCVTGQPKMCAQGGIVCNTLVPETLGCCKPKSGPAFQAGPCDCKTCHLGTFRPGKCNCFCPAVVKPICCSENGKQLTKGNSCECLCAGGKLVGTGRCPVPRRPCICTRQFQNTCCKRKEGGKLFQASNKCTCECVGSIIGPGQCPERTCADVKCGNCVDTVEGPKCSAPLPASSTSTVKNTCANVLCAPATPCCIEYNSGPKCIKRDGYKCPNSPAVTKPPPQCPCPKNIDPTCCKRNGRLFTAPNKCLCECKGTIMGRGPCPKITCANVRCDGPCLDTIKGPKCQSSPTTEMLPQITCRNVKCSRARPCCIETKRGPKCVSRQHRKCPTRLTCRNVKCSRNRPCCIETKGGPKCVCRQHRNCPTRLTCRNVKCSRARPCCIETKGGPECVCRQH